MDGRVYIDIIDNGPGIKKEDLEKINLRVDSIQTGSEGLESEVDSLELELLKLEEQNLQQEERIFNNWDMIDENQQDIEEIKEKGVKPAEENEDVLPEEDSESPEEETETSSNAKNIEDDLTQVQKRTNEKGEEEIVEVELAEGFYVVIESFRSIENADRYTTAFNDRGSKAIVVHFVGKGS